MQRLHSAAVQLAVLIMAISNPAKVQTARQPMANPLRIVLLAALTVFVVSPFSAGSIAAGKICGDDQDCRKNEVCKIVGNHKSGRCVSAFGVAKKKQYSEGEK
jgi:hypothetical protein